MAPQNVFLFVNKDSSSPSLSRNTGREAAIASRINKHVQQQRFRKHSSSRKDWYRSFNRSDSSGSSTPSSVGTYLDWEDSTVEPIPRKSSNALPARHSSIARARSISQNTPRSVPSAPVVEDDENKKSDLRAILSFPLQTITSRAGDSVDPFGNTVQPITPALRDVLARHLHWAVSSSISEYTIHEGIRRILSTIMTDRMHSAAFLAMATAQQRRTAKVTLPQHESAEFYSYKATKLIREHISANYESIDRYTFVDVFRLAMSEWLNGNHKAARVHFSYVAQIWPSFQPQDWGEQHNFEVISSEDVFLAIDTDEKPLLELNWEPESNGTLDQMEYTDRDLKLETFEENSMRVGNDLQDMIMNNSNLHSIVTPCYKSLSSISDYCKADFASSLAGHLWVIKRRLHATLHRLQSISCEQLPAVEEILRRALIILLFLASTTPARRLARTDFLQLALRLRSAMAIARKDKRECIRTSHGFWFWISMAGLIATREAISLDDQYSEHSEEVRVWFLKRCVLFARAIQTSASRIDVVRDVLRDYLYFEYLHEAALVEVMDALRTDRTTDLVSGDG